jgi:hypothetical protein
MRLPEAKFSSATSGQALMPVRYWFKQAEEALWWLEVERAMENLCAA